MVGSIFLSSKADKALSEAMTYSAKVDLYYQQCENTCSLLHARSSAGRDCSSAL